MAIRILTSQASQLDRFIRDEQLNEYRRARLQDPSLMFHMVLWEGGIKIEVFSDEHPPPHFRLRHKNRTANFAIADCEHLNGDLRLPHRAVKKWWLRHRRQIAEAWNTHRPADCPVGPVSISDLAW